MSSARLARLLVLARRRYVNARCVCCHHLTPRVELLKFGGMCGDCEFG
jgi:hypothetical protein